VDALVRLAKDDMAAVDALIIARMQSDVPVIPLLAEHLISAGGKRLRPLLTVAAARAVGTRGDIAAATKLAASVEFIHTATLLHDDIVDGSEMRRGKVAAHLIWGAASSVLVGDFLFARAFELMVETDSLRALGILATASSVIAEGEVLQLTRAHDLNLDQATYLQIIRAKTAELFAAAAESGAVGAGATEEQVKALRDYGMALGIAFQLADDALDYGSDTATLGKNAGDGVRGGGQFDMFEGDSIPRLRLIPDPGYEIVDLGVAAPCMPVDGLALGFGKDAIPFCSKGFRRKPGKGGQAGEQGQGGAAMHVLSPGGACSAPVLRDS
jgi:octaprenyl-diphosphate synthase